MEPPVSDFWRILTSFYADNGRSHMPWRQPDATGNFDPYQILVSELMLQQTQVARVIPKYVSFLERFPDAGALAAAQLADVITLWSGLGYNRRAKHLWVAAAMIQHDLRGTFPDTLESLQRLPGVGPGTAGAIMAYAFNKSVLYLETNIRTVLIYHFYPNEMRVRDGDLRQALARIVDHTSRDETLPPREFYWAMMDYGTFLKNTVGNLNRVSSSYSKQSAFQGSRRQLRGLIIRLLTGRPHERQELLGLADDARSEAVLNDLVEEGLIHIENNTVSLA